MSRYIDADDFLDLFYVASAGQDRAFVETVEMVIEDTPTADVAPANQLRDITSGLICESCDVFTHGGMTQVECVSCILRHVKKVIGEEVQDG